MEDRNASEERDSRSGDPDRYQRVKTLLFQALDQPPTARRPWLQEACADPALRAEVEELLLGFETASGFLNRPARLPPEEVRADAPPALPEHIGRYRILERLGWGAMGVVYRAEQDHPRRQVALKVLRLDCVDEVVRKRFEREARSLGRLSHPGIAQIHEAGVAETETGEQPFLALELVPGGTLRQHCQERGLGRRERVELVRAVCAAVQHAHEHGVLHRDLKPDNILVDGGGRPKVVDFGVARLVEDAHESLRTRTGQLLGTVAYMSPEQLRGAQVDERSDQFSLAAILYELLTGRLPLESRGRTLTEALRAAESEDPTPPSAHDRELRGDLETVLLKALDPDPARRYVDVASFADDLGRFLEGRPVLARRPTRAYQLRRLVGRHRLLAGSLAGTFAALTVGLALALAWMHEARTAEHRLDAERRSVLSLSNLRRVEALRARADELHPFGPALVAPLRAWLAEAETLRADLDRHRAELERLRTIEAEGRLAELDAGGVPGGSAWYLETLATLVAEIEALLGEGGSPGLTGVVQARLALSEELEARTLVEPAAAWHAALDALGRPGSPYGGLRIEPQLGLVPLGTDPRSGLEEFLVHGTGTCPVRRGDGTLVTEEASGMVLVLVPGGRFLMGAQRDDPDAPNYDPFAQGHEGPPREVELDPFLVGKHEVTQAQWIELLSSNPSYWAPPKAHKGFRFSLRHPVEHVSRDDALDFVRRIACDLPTEAQWEYVARAGEGVRVPEEVYCEREHMACQGSNIGYHLPVGSREPNAFGLHDTMGNVNEFCRDVYKVAYYELPLRAGDGLVEAAPDAEWSLRGGSFSRWGNGLRVCMRLDSQSTVKGVDRSFRVVRSLQGAWSRPGEDRESETSGSHEGARLR